MFLIQKIWVLNNLPSISLLLQSPWVFHPKKLGFYHAICTIPQSSPCVFRYIRLLVACWKDVHLPGLVAWMLNSGNSMENSIVILWCLCYTLIHYNLEIYIWRYLEIYLEIFGDMWDMLRCVEMCWDVLGWDAALPEMFKNGTCSLPFSAISIEKWASSPAWGITPGVWKIQHPKWIKMVDEKPSKCWIDY